MIHEVATYRNSIIPTREWLVKQDWRMYCTYVLCMCSSCSSQHASMNYKILPKMHHAAVAATILREGNYDYSVRDTEPTYNVHMGADNEPWHHRSPARTGGRWQSWGRCSPSYTRLRAPVGQREKRKHQIRKVRWEVPLETCKVLHLLKILK